MNKKWTNSKGTECIAPLQYLPETITETCALSLVGFWRLSN